MEMIKDNWPDLRSFAEALATDRGITLAAATRIVAAEYGMQLPGDRPASPDPRVPAGLIIEGKEESL